MGVGVGVGGIRGCGCRFGCSAGVLKFNKSTVSWITYKSAYISATHTILHTFWGHSEIDHGCNVGVTRVYGGCKLGVVVGVAMGTVFLSDFAWVRWWVGVVQDGKSWVRWWVGVHDSQNAWFSGGYPV